MWILTVAGGGEDSIAIRTARELEPLVAPPLRRFNMGEAVSISSFHATPAPDRVLIVDASSLVCFHFCLEVRIYICLRKTANHLGALMVWSDRASLAEPLWCLTQLLASMRCLGVSTD